MSLRSIVWSATRTAELIQAEKDLKELKETLRKADITILQGHFARRDGTWGKFYVVPPSR